jgi:DNA (cytosine-5)-methyltransferase 1
MKKPTAIDLFSGCGGLSLGLKQAGFHVLGAIENDPLAVETYRANHKGIVVWPEDIRDVSPRAVKRKLRLRKGDLDLLAGCPPCQGFSTMTTLNGKRSVDDPRNDLVFQFVRFVRELVPKTVMLENVPGLAKDARFREVRRELEVLGYQVSSAVLDAADYGVPQRRRRTILLAGRSGTIPFAPPAKHKKTVREALKRLRPDRARTDPLHTLGETRSPKVAKLIREIPRNGGSRLDLGKRRQLNCHRNCDGFKDVYGRMAWDDVAPTITGGCCNPSKGRFLHPTKNRCITLREAALLQTFPATYFFSTKRGKLEIAHACVSNRPPPR